MDSTDAGTGTHTHTDTEIGTEAGLEQAAVRGGAYLVVRESVGLGVRVGGLLLLTLRIGPTNYGVFVTASSIAAVVALIAQLGTEVYLVRRQPPPTEETYAEVATLLLTWTLVVTGVALALSLLAPRVLHEPGLDGPLRVLLATVPINVLWAPAQAKIERAFRYRAMGLLELSGDLTLYGVGVAFAFAGQGVWAPVIGYLAWQAVLLIGSWAVAGLRPRWRWDRTTARDACRFGSSYLSSTLFGSGIDLVNPLVVGHYLGAMVVGQIALGLRLVQLLGFVGRATWRLSLVLFGRLSQDIARLRSAVGKVMAAQVVLLAPLFAALAVAAPYAVELLGHRWAVASRIFPYLALRALVSTITLSLSTVGYALNRTRLNVVQAGVALAAQVVVAIVLVPRMGPTGYGLSEVALLVGALILHVGLRRQVDIDYGDVLPWLVITVPILFFVLVPWPVRPIVFVPAVVLLAFRRPRRQAFGLMTSVLRTLRAGRAAARAPESADEPVAAS